MSFLTLPNEVSVAATYWGGIVELQEVIALAARGALNIHDAIKAPSGEPGSFGLI